jgi:threonine aldolase
MRFVSAQMEALLNSDLWIKLAGHSNQIAHQISQAIAGNPRLKLLHPVEANELFVLMPSAAIEALEQEGYRFYRWETDQGPCIRLVTAFDTDPVDADALADAIIKAIS